MGSSRRPPAIMGVPMRHLTLVLLTVQNSALILIMHYSRIMPPVGGQRYLTSTAVFLNEVFKLAVSLSMALYDLSVTIPASSPATALFSELFRQVFTGDSWKLAIPAMLYTLQNSLQYLAISNLDAATFQVTYQLKILSTALFSVLLLRRSISGSKWVSLILLTIGVAIVQTPGGDSMPTFQDLVKEHTEWSMSRSLEEMRDLGNKAAEQLLDRRSMPLAAEIAISQDNLPLPAHMAHLASHGTKTVAAAFRHLFPESLAKRSATYEGIDADMTSIHPPASYSVGLAAVVTACILSGLAGVYFERIIKDSGAHVSIWIRNVQLSFYSIFPALFLGVMFVDGAEISQHGFFAGYNWAVWTAIACQATGGVIVSLSILYTSNIAKNFATSISILMSCIFSAFFFEFKITLSFFVGTAVVLAATYLYSLPPAKQRRDSSFASMTEKHGDIVGLDVPSQGRTTSRPPSPSPDRRQLRSKTSESRFDRRDD